MDRVLGQTTVPRGGGAVLAGALGASVGTNVLADGHDVPIVITSINPETELFDLRNEGDEAVDLSGYIVHYEWDRERDAEDAIPDGAVIEAGAQLTVDTGCTDLGGDIVLGDFGNCQFLMERGVLALLSPGREVVDTCGYENPFPREDTGDSEGERDDEDTGEDEADDDGEDEHDDGDEDDHTEEEEKTDEESDEDDC